jgi:uncharacterized membrane protein YsdA (DUF1294 family)
MWIIVCTYLLVINIAGYGFMRSDKSRARHKKYRIPERQLFITAILGGSVGVYTGMHVLRHKTKHASFYIGIPAILIIQVILLGYMLGKLLVETT